MHFGNRHTRKNRRHGHHRTRRGGGPGPRRAQADGEIPFSHNPEDPAEADLLSSSIKPSPHKAWFTSPRRAQADGEIPFSHNPEDPAEADLLSSSAHQTGRGRTRRGRSKSKRRSRTMKRGRRKGGCRSKRRGRGRGKSKRRRGGGQATELCKKYEDHPNAPKEMRQGCSALKSHCGLINQMGLGEYSQIKGYEVSCSKTRDMIKRAAKEMEDPYYAPR